MTSEKDRGDPRTIRNILGTTMDILVYNPPGQSDPRLAIEASRAGALGIVDMEYLGMDDVSGTLNRLLESGVAFGVRVDPMSDKLQTLITEKIPPGLKVLVSMPKEGLPDMVRSTIYETAHSMGLKVFQEVCTSEEALTSIGSGADAIIARGSEGGGRVSSLTSEDLMKEIRIEAPTAAFIQRGGVGPDDIRSCSTRKLSGIVLDSQLFTMEEAGLPEVIRKMVGSMAEGDSFVVGSTIDRNFRLLTNPGLRKEIEAIEPSMGGEDGKTVYKTLKTRIEEMVIDSMTSSGDVLYPVGLDGMHAEAFEQYGGLDEALSDLTEVSRSASGDGRDEPFPAPIREEAIPRSEPDVPPDYFDRSIAIVGVGSVFPRGIGNDNYWKMIMEGVDACIEVPPERWDWRLYYNEDRKVPDKSYTKIGAFITDLQMDFKEFKLPPRVFDQLDLFQRYAMKATKEALEDAGLLDDTKLDRTRIGAIISNSGGGEQRDWASVRVSVDQIFHWMEEIDLWKELPLDAREEIKKGLGGVLDRNLLTITEDSMPGSLPNISSGRLANLFNFMGPNFITDAACASSFAAIYSARNSLLLGQMDVAVSGGTDSMMSTQTFIEFCKIGALTPDGSRPFSEGANGFLMGEGSGIVILKRVEDAVRDGDRIYAIIRGMGASSDGKGKGITAPNPQGQTLAVKVALADARVDPSTISFIEAHGTSTAVGDVAELYSLMEIYEGLPENSVGLTSVKSQIGHLKSAAGAAGIIKAAMAMKNRIIPPQINFKAPNPYYDWEKTPFYVITEPKPWERIRPDIPRRCAVSAFGFGGTNFHLILEEFDRSIFDAWKRAKEKTVSQTPRETDAPDPVEIDREGIVSYLEKHGVEEGEAFLFSSENPLDLLKQAEDSVSSAERITEAGGRLRDAFTMPSYSGRYRLGISVNDPEHFRKQVDTLKKVGMNEKALMALAAKGIFVGDRERIDHGKVCFMFPGQGSQYLNMFRELKYKYRVVRDTFNDADEVMKDLIPDPLSSYVFKDLDPRSEEYIRASDTLRQTEYNQPSMLTVDTAMYKLLTHIGIRPDLAMGHSLGEYGALIASGVMDFGDALKAVSARGREMRDLKVDDPGKMASVMCGLEEVENVLGTIDGYVIAANKNCFAQTVIAGETAAVEEAIRKFQDKGIDAVQIPVSHAFHSAVVAPVKNLLREVLSRLTIHPPKIPLLANVNGDYYPMEGDPSRIKEQILDLLKEQVASSVEWISQVQRAYGDGCRTFIEVGPKRALTSFAYNLLEEEVKKGKVFPITSNHPKKGAIATFNEMISSLWSLGFDLKLPEKDDGSFYTREFLEAFEGYRRPAGLPQPPSASPVRAEDRTVEDAPEASGIEISSGAKDPGFSRFLEANRGAIERFLREVHSSGVPAGKESEPQWDDVDLSGLGTTRPTRKGARVVVSGVSFGLPGTFKKVFDEKNLDYLIEGRNLIENIDRRFVDRYIEKNILRVDKRPDGSAELIRLDDEKKVAHLAGILGEFDLHREFGVPEGLIDSLDITSQLAIASGLLALKDAGIPLVRRYAQTSTGSFLPENWELPLELQEDTGIIFASAFPGFDRLNADLADFYSMRIGKAKVRERERILGMLREKVKGTELEEELERWNGENPVDVPEYHFPRNFMFRVLAMGHSQFAQYIKAKGPNTQVNSACATSTMAVGIAQDWIQAGRCKRVIVIGADFPSSERNMEWLGSSLLAMGALTPEEDVTKAALPFDRRRKGMILGSGVAALVVEAEEEPGRRGMNPLVEIVGSHIGNSAFHGSRLDVAHIARSMDRFMTKVERENGLDRNDIAHRMLFMSHETYTPARGGSSAAEVESLRRTFGERFREIVILNTKGYTGHAFAACLEDPVLIRCLEKGVAIPIANLTPDQVDPQFEGMQLSKGGRHERDYGLRLAAGFGSQLSFLLLKRPDDKRRYFDEGLYNRWLNSIATTSPVEPEVEKNVLRLRDSGRDALIPHRAVKRESSEIGYIRDIDSDVDPDIFEKVKEEVMEIFARKMNFPPDTIDIDADLETDMGIDSVKQVELFGAARINFELPKDEGVNLKDYPTLRHVILYIISKMPRDRKIPTPAKEETVEEKSYWDMAREKVVEIVSEKTGYPEDMLDLDLDLESDLGIDTVKQVELFAMAREDFNLPKDDTINLQDLNTLRKIVDYVVLQTGGSVEETARAKKKEETAVVKEEVREPSPEGRWEMVKDKVIEIVAEKTGYPEDMLEIDLDLESDLGIDTVKQVELFAMAREDFDLPRDDTINLQDLNTLRKIIDYVMEKKGPEIDAPNEREEPDIGKKTEDTHPEKTVEAPEDGKDSDADWDRLKEKIISIVAEKTGYPEDMLEIDLDLESDLGIDTVKQVELFAMAREEFKLPKDDTVNLSDLPTLRHIIDYVSKLLSSGALEPAPAEEEKAPEEKVEEKPPKVISAEEEKAPEQKVKGPDRWDEVKAKVIEIVAEKTGYPDDMLELDLDLESDLGIDTVKQVELFAMAREDFDLPRDDTVNLSDMPTLRHIIDYVVKLTSSREEPSPEAAEKVEARTDYTVEELKERINRWVLQVDEAPMVQGEESPVKGRKALVLGGDAASASLVEKKLGAEVVHLPGNVDHFEEDDIKDIEGIVCLSPLFLEDDPDPADWDPISSTTSKLLFRACLSMGRRLKDGGFLYSITAMGGKLALDRSVNPFNGSVSGFTKAVGREYPNADVICLDVDPSMGVERALHLLLAEISHTDHPLEVGCDGEKRYLPAMRICMPPDESNIDLRDGMSVLVSGGGGGITAEIIKGLARRARLKLHIIDITEILPDTGELAGLDEEGLSRKREEIKERLLKEGGKVTPVILDREFSRITRSIGVFRLMEELRELGAEPHYHRSDIMDTDAIARIASENGPFHGIIHAAGIDQSRSLMSKKKEDFDRVFDIKVRGAKAILAATIDHPLEFFLTFTSVAGRFGNAGQVDYSSANDTLAKMRGAFLKYHPDCVYKAVGWSAWANVGMASRGSVKTLLEMGGITFIPVDDGVEYAISEILHGREREVYYSGSLGPMDRGGVLKWSEGIHPPVAVEDQVKVPPASREEKIEPQGLAPLLDEIVERTDSRILVRRSFDGVRERFLPDHSIMGKMVLPGVMGLEIFAETAQIMFPDLDVFTLRDVVFNKAVSVDGKEHKEIFVEGKLSSEEDEVRTVDLKLYSILKPKKAKKEIESVHYTGTVVMGKYDPECQKVQDHPVRPRNVIAQVLRDEIYEHLFHRNRFRVLEGIEVLKDGELTGVYHAPPDDLFDPSTGWENSHLVTVPMQTECGFQVAGAYVLDRFKMMALPVKVGSIEYHGEMTPAEGGMAWVRFEGREENVFRFDVDFIDMHGNVRFSYRDYQLKSMMPYDGELKGDHSVHFEEFRSPLDDIRVFRIDLDSVPADLEEYVRYFDEDEWKRLISEKMNQKRRKEHAMGRVIAKLAVSWVLATERSKVVPVTSVKVLTEEKGKPYAVVFGERVEISISHSHRWAVCSVGGRVHGMDIELAEHRDISFVDEAFTGEEAELISRKQKQYDLGENMVQTLFFSAKEAYLKKTGIGMGVNLKSVRCNEALQLPNKGGISFEVLVEHDGKEERVLAHIPSAYVLTVCA